MTFCGIAVIYVLLLKMKVLVAIIFFNIVKYLIKLCLPSRQKLSLSFFFFFFFFVLGLVQDSYPENYPVWVWFSI